MGLIFFFHVLFLTQIIYLHTSVFPTLLNTYILLSRLLIKKSHKLQTNIYTHTRLVRKGTIKCMSIHYILLCDIHFSLSFFWFLVLLDLLLQSHYCVEIYHNKNNKCNKKQGCQIVLSKNKYKKICDAKEEEQRSMEYVKKAKDNTERKEDLIEG